jgi:hypothetical protein
MRKLDPDAAPVRVPLRDWKICATAKANLERQIAEELAAGGLY